MMLGPVLNRIRDDSTLLDRIAKFTSLCLEQGQSFIESTKPPFPNSC